MREYVFVCLLLAFSVASAVAQGQPGLPRLDDPGESEVFDVDGRAERISAGAGRALHICEVASSRTVLPEVADAARETCLAWLEFERDKYARLIAPEFRWQQFSTRFIFATVLGLVGLGALLACVQFRIALKAAGQVPQAPAAVASLGEGATDSERTSTLSDRLATLGGEISVGPQGVSIKSSFLGLLLLALSLAFFHLYLVHVYPIHVLGEKAPASIGAEPSALSNR